MNNENYLINLLKTFLKTSEQINKIDESEEEIYSLISNMIHYNKESTFPIQIPSSLTNDLFWKDRIESLLTVFNNNFKILETDEDEEKKEEYLNYANNMKIIKNRQRIDIKNLNDNFQLISKGIALITDELFGESTLGRNNKYLQMFNEILKQLIPLWENVLYLWLNFLLKERNKIEKPIVKYVYLNENKLINQQKYDTEKIDLNVYTGIKIDDILDKIECYIDEYPNSHLCIIPIIRTDLEQEYHGEECYPGIFYHAPNFNSQFLKCDKKFMFYPFRNLSTKNSSIEPYNPFSIQNTINSEYHFLRAGFENNSEYNENNYLQLSDIAYGYRIYGDHLYYSAPFNNISNLREVIPKKYYSAVRSFITGDFYIYDGMLAISDFKINYQDMVANNVEKNLINNVIAHYEPTEFESTNFICLSLDEDLAQTNKRYLLKESIFMKGYKELPVSQTLTKIRNFRSKICKTQNITPFKFQFFSPNCISGRIYSSEENYEYLIEYIPLKYEQPNSGENNWVRESNINTLKNYADSNLKDKDNDLLEKHVIWDNERNNILEDKFVLRIGQHIEADATPLYSDLIPDNFKFEDSIYYFDYKNALNHDIDEKSSEIIKYYNSGTIEVGAYLNIPFIKNPNKRLQFYPDFLSHNFGTDNLIPLTSIEYKTDNDKPEYFSYNKVFRDYQVNRQQYFQIYTIDGKEHFEDDNWCIKMIEVIEQETPIEETFFENNTLPPNNCVSMEELYQYYINHKNEIKDEKFLSFFSQLCPSKIQDTADSSFISNAMEESVRTSYAQIFPAIFGNKAEQMYSEIAKALLLDGTYYSTYTKEVGSFTMTENYDPATSLEPESNYPKIGTQDVKIQFEIQSTQEQLQRLKNIDDNWTTPTTANSNQFQYFYKNYTEKDRQGNIIKKYSYPHVQFDSIDNLNTNYKYDECLLDYIDMNGSKEEKFVYNNFACRHRVFPNQEGAASSTSGYVHFPDNVQPLIIRFSLFGANFPAHNYLCQEPQFWSPSSSTGQSDSEQNDWQNIIWLGSGSTSAGKSYYSYFNPGKSLLLYFPPRVEHATSFPSSVGNFYLSGYASGIGPVPGYISFPDKFSPFYNIMAYNTYRLNNQDLTIAKNRQYPHIYLLSNKTLFSQKKLFKQYNYNKVKYQCFSTLNKIKDLSSYYSALTTLEDDSLLKIPYPFPSLKRNISSSSSNIKLNGENYLRNQMNYQYPAYTTSGDIFSGDPYIYGQLEGAPAFAKDNYNNRPDKYGGLSNSSRMRYGNSPPPLYATDIYYRNQYMYREMNIKFISLNMSKLFGGDFYHAPDEYTARAEFSSAVTVNAKRIDALDENSTAYYDQKEDISNSLNYSYNNVPTATMNLQIIIHYFGPNGTYARKVMTRQLTNNSITPEDHFVWDGETNKLLYREWTNTWKIDYKNESTYNIFKNSLSNKNIFKQSPSIINSQGVILDFENYPNTGLENEGTHSEN